MNALPTLQILLHEGLSNRLIDAGDNVDIDEGYRRYVERWAWTLDEDQVRRHISRRESTLYQVKDWTGFRGTKARLEHTRDLLARVLSMKFGISPTPKLYTGGRYTVLERNPERATVTLRTPEEWVVCCDPVAVHAPINLSPLGLEQVRPGSTLVYMYTVEGINHFNALP